MTDRPLPPGIADTYRRAATVENDRCAQRRRRVLAHPDLAQRLTQPPLAWSDPEKWNGYVPPATWHEEINTSPQRAALMALLRDVAEREQQEQQGADAYDDTAQEAF